MKRIAILMVTLMLGLAASANSIRYFTAVQANRTVSYLNAQKELMIYCGYDYEVETYVILSDVWKERVNSAYYEIWIYGFDAYTGDEIYMPIDLNCIWLFSGGRTYSAAQYLRFRTSVVAPTFSWYVPAYNTFTRRPHAVTYTRTYHYDVHLYGWMPPVVGSSRPGQVPPPPLPAYYNRMPQAPRPVPAAAWTPGVNRPQLTTTTVPSSGSSPRTAATHVVTPTPSSSPRTAATTTTPATTTTTTTSPRAASTTTSSSPRSASTTPTASSPRSSATTTTTTTATTSSSPHSSATTTTTTNTNTTSAKRQKTSTTSSATTSSTPSTTSSTSSSSPRSSASSATTTTTSTKRAKSTTTQTPASSTTTSTTARTSSSPRTSSTTTRTSTSTTTTKRSASSPRK